MTNIVCLLYVGWITNYVAHGGHKVAEGGGGGGEADRKSEEDARGETLRIVERLERLESVVNEHIRDDSSDLRLVLRPGGLNVIGPARSGRETFGLFSSFT
ncbi:hypothetical protein F2P81_006794 [Scophthalmus maximus]|uniref:Uncharacterized protein n=1 Tax=Scophthalmus maximus TaxID=52904 RepID=A0A6A4T079_SCOMX|nr:hypothetical protein F2P81_006794 [Scophthalmus maximus]